MIQQNSVAYRTLVNLTVLDIAVYTECEQKNLLKKNIGKDKILDRTETTKLAANLFRITQTNDRLQNELINENIIGEQKANSIHFMIGGKVRQTIKDISGTMPENLPPEVHIKEIEKKIKKKIGDNETKYKKLKQ